MERKRSTLRMRAAQAAAVALAALAILGLAMGLPGAIAGPAGAPALEAAPPTLISYQGFVTVSGTPHSGDGYFKFAIVDSATGDGTTNYWANDGTASGEPASGVHLTVSHGLFDVLLGDTGMQPIADTVFDHTATYLRVWFSQTAEGPYQTLEPNQRIGSAAYALRSQRAVSAAAADAVPWSGITAMPAGFADGVDDDTTYTAGSNLTLGDNTFALDPNPSVTSLTASGEVKLGTSGAACAASNAGSLRYSGSAIEFCNGSAWQALQVPHISFFAAPTFGSIPATVGVWTALSFDSEVYDDGDHLSGNLYTVTEPGVYRFACRLAYEGYLNLALYRVDTGTLLAYSVGDLSYGWDSASIDVTVKVASASAGFQCRYYTDRSTTICGRYTAPGGTFAPVSWFTGSRLY